MRVLLSCSGPTTERAGRIQCHGSHLVADKVGKPRGLEPLTHCLQAISPLVPACCEHSISLADLVGSSYVQGVSD
jgi:hypothetical protein